MKEKSKKQKKGCEICCYLCMYFGSLQSAVTLLSSVRFCSTDLQICLSFNSLKLYKILKKKVKERKVSVVKTDCSTYRRLGTDRQLLGVALTVTKSCQNTRSTTGNSITHIGMLINLISWLGVLQVGWPVLIGTIITLCHGEMGHGGMEHDHLIIIYFTLYFYSWGRKMV